jgi:glutaredoxin
MSPVIIYTTSTCFYCKIAKEFLVKHGISFEERDVIKNPEFIKEIEEKSHQHAVPVIEIGDDIFVGFDRPIVAQVLGIHE